MFWCTSSYSSSLYSTTHISEASNYTDKHKKRQKKAKKQYKKANKIKRQRTKTFAEQKKRLDRQRNLTVKDKKYAGQYNKFWVD